MTKSTFFSNLDANNLGAGNFSAEKSSLSLLGRVRQQDADAWSQLVQLYGPLVAYWCRQQGLSNADTADVTQNVFISVSKSIDTFRPRHDSREGSFRSWLWTITRNKIRDWARGQRLDRGEGGSSAQARMGDIPEMIEEESSPDVIHQLLQRALEQIRDQFQPQTWLAFWRTVIDGQATSLVADQLEMKPAAIRQARSRVLRQLRLQLGDLDID